MRFQLDTLNDARDDSREQDSWGVNCFVEKEDELRAVKRPGLAKTVDVVGSGTVGQGIFIWPDYTGLNPKIVMIWDDALWIYEFDYTLDLGWDLTTAGSGSSMAYNGASSYSTNDRVVAPTGPIVSDGSTPDEDVLWYAVQAVSGIAPAHSAAAYPYWSRYRDKPVGGHPVMIPAWSSVQSPPAPGPDDAYTITTVLQYTGNAGGYSASYSGSAAHAAGPFNPGDITNTYTNFAQNPSVLLLNGFDTFPASSTYVYSDVPEVAANDYSRSHLGT